MQVRDLLIALYERMEVREVKTTPLAWGGLAAAGG